ncbi:MAG: cystathionine beta-lyase, partial [Betaproteobacteria bacterium]|nr:cystathionine beta-lyase [Betaproteobacteria bacterium]
AFCDRLTVFGLGYSWAGPMSLAVPYSLDADRGCGEALVGVVVRFAVGLAHVDDLRADLAQALDGMVADA